MTSRFAVVGSSNQTKAAAALRQAEMMRPQLQSFINAIINASDSPSKKREKKGMKLSFNGSGSCTSATEIFLTPPLDLGVYRVHSPRKCNIYDEMGNSLCSACREQESFMAVALHECAHTVYDSFKKADDVDRGEIRDQWVENAVANYVAGSEMALKGGSDYEYVIASARRRFHRIFEARTADLGSEMLLMPLAGQLHPYLPLILNALDDARVNTMLHTYRAGTTRMFKVRLLATMENGVYDEDTGELNLWSAAPVEMQVCLFAYLAASNYDLVASDYFVDEVVEVWSDKILTSLLREVPGLVSATGTFNLAQRVLARLNELGYLIVEQPETPEEPEGGDGEPDEDTEEGEGEGEPVPSPAPNPGGGGEDEGDGESGDGEDGSPGGDGGEGEGESGDGEDESSGGDGGDGEDESSSDGDGAGEGEGEGDPTGGDPSDGGDASEGSGADGASDDAASGSSDGAGGGGIEGGRKGKQTSRKDAVEGARETQRVMDKLMGHGDRSKERLDARIDVDEDGEPTDSVERESEPASDDASWGDANLDMESTITQGAHFDRISPNYSGVSVVKMNSDHTVTGYRSDNGSLRDLSDAWRDSMPRYNLSDEKLIEAASTAARAVAELRRIFTRNRAVRTTPNQKSGRIDARTVGRKLKTGKVDVFKRREAPTDRSYAVVIGLDVSGSTMANDTPDYLTRVAHMKAAAFAQAEMLHKAGIPFLFWCHTGSRGYGDDFELLFIEIKGWKEKWGKLQKDRLLAIGPMMANLDGHTMMAYRRQLDSRPEEVGIMLYYTDGAMPAENREEEQRVLDEEVAKSKMRKDLQVLCVGVLNDEPMKYGLDTVRYDGIQDLSKVVKRLEKALSGR